MAAIITTANKQKRKHAWMYDDPSETNCQKCDALLFTDEGILLDANAAVCFHRENGTRYKFILCGPCHKEYWKRV